MSDRYKFPVPIEYTLASLLKEKEPAAHSAFDLAALLDKKPAQLSRETLATLLGDSPHSAASFGLSALNKSTPDELFSLAHALRSAQNPAQELPVNYLRDLLRNGLTSSGSISVKGMALEDRLTGWTGPSSTTEQEKQERTESMIREAIANHAPFRDCRYLVFAKGSYRNNTNVRADSDVDISVQCIEAEYWDEYTKDLHVPCGKYTGLWTPDKLRTELVAALRAKFPNQVDTSGSTAIQINSGSARVDADVVPCFSYRYYRSDSQAWKGTKIFKTDGGSIVNYPAQQLRNGTEKNKRTKYAYKKAARILKRLENAMTGDGTFRDLPSYFVECLAYNCPDHIFSASTWTATLREMLLHIWTALQGDEPNTGRWIEVNECFFLFHPHQKWTRKDGREFAAAAWNYLGFK